MIQLFQVLLCHTKTCGAMRREAQGVTSSTSTFLAAACQDANEDSFCAGPPHSAFFQLHSHLTSIPPIFRKSTQRQQNVSNNNQHASAPLSFLARHG
jgi:hypothetical protein